MVQVCEDFDEPSGLKRCDITVDEAMENFAQYDLAPKVKASKPLVSVRLHGGRTRRMLTLEVGRSHPNATLQTPAEAQKTIRAWLKDECKRVKGERLLRDLQGQINRKNGNRNKSASGKRFS